MPKVFVGYSLRLRPGGRVVRMSEPIELPETHVRNLQALSVGYIGNQIVFRYKPRGEKHVDVRRQVPRTRLAGLEGSLVIDKTHNVTIRAGETEYLFRS